MNSNIFPSFLKNKTALLSAAGILFFVAVSLATLTTKPRIWTDEAVSIDIARNFQTQGVLDVKTAPDIFSGFGERLQSTGYPVTVPLAGFFGLFGYGFTQARFFMLLWSIGALAFLAWLGRKFFSEKESVFAFLLIVTFASFHNSARTVVGDIPGFLFFLSGLYFLFSRHSFAWAGFFLGISVVAKPSVFGLIIPALVVTYLFHYRSFFRTLVPVALGMLPAGLLWIFLNLPAPFAKETWTTLFGFYQNPYSASVGSNVAANLSGFFHSPTLIYFGIFFLCILVARFFVTDDKRVLYTFTLVYSIFAFMYYLRSPGWLRYILVAELLILFLLPHAFSVLAKRFCRKDVSVFCERYYVYECVLSGLVLLQCVQLFTVSHIFSSAAPRHVADAVNSQFSGKSVGVLNAIEVAVLLETPARFLAMDLTGLPQVGTNPLLQENLPDVVVSYPTQRFFVEGKGIIATRYSLFDTIGGYMIYARK